jgi:hypothetical protein
MNRRAAVLAVIFVVLFIGGLVLLPSFASAVRLVAGLALLFGAGLAISWAAIPPDALDMSRRVTISLVSSIGLLVVGGLLLNQLPAGFSTPAWLALIVGVVLVALGVALVRGHDRRLRRFRRRDQAHVIPAVDASAFEPAVGWDDQEPRGTRPGRPAWLPILSMSLALILAFVALSVARFGAFEQDRAQAFTEFWALPDEVVGGEVHLGIVSHEPITTDFTVRIESGGQPFTTMDGIRLAPGASWDGVIELPPAPSPSASPSSTGGPTPRASTQPSGPASTMRATLYRAGSEAPYREVTIRGQSPT